MELILKSSVHGEHIVYYDKEDHELISKHKWFPKKNRDRYYATANKFTGKKNSPISMHRLLMNFPKDMEVDHIDNNGLNNQKYNLRLGTHSQNGMNRGNQSNNNTGYKGVYLYNGKGRVKRYWTYIWLNGKRISGGYFEKITEAAKKYNELAKKHHGEFAFLNIIKDE